MYPYTYFKEKQSWTNLFTWFLNIIKYLMASAFNIGVELTEMKIKHALIWYWEIYKARNQSCQNLKEKKLHKFNNLSLNMTIFYSDMSWTFTILAIFLKNFERFLNACKSIKCQLPVKLTIRILNIW